MRFRTAFAILLTLLATSAFARPNFRQRIEDFKNQKQNSQQNAQQEEININGTNRTYIVDNVNYNKSNPRPLMIVLHGGGGSAQQAKSAYGMSEKARAENFVVIYPNGSGRQADKFLTWNATHCCGYAMENNANDISFISALIDKAIAQYGVDKGRIYVTGMSNGAMMTHQLAIALPNKITAIATDVGTMFGDEKMPSSPVPVLIMNGMKDEMLPFEGGTLGKFDKAWDGTKMKPANYQAQFWANANHCQNTPKTFENDEIIQNDFICPANAQVRQIIVKEGTHTWFGATLRRKNAPAPSYDIDANDEIWKFVSQFKK